MKFVERMHAPKIFIDPMNFAQVATSRQIRHFQPHYSTLYQKNYRIGQLWKQLVMTNTYMSC